MGKIKSLPLTLIILSKHEEEPTKERLEKYLPQVEEIVVWDDGTGSKEKLAALESRSSKKIKVFSNELAGDFAAHRNEALEQVTTEWTLFLDADEDLNTEAWQEIQIILENDQHDAVIFPRRDIFLGRQLRFGETGNTAVLRMAKTYLAKGKWQRAVHEVWNIPSERVATANSNILHTPHPTIRQFLAKLHWYASLEPSARHRLPFYTILWQLLFFPTAKFLQNYVWRHGWRDGFPGLVHALCMSYYSLITRVYMFEVWHA